MFPRRTWTIAVITLTLVVGAGIIVEHRTATEKWNDASPGDQRLLVAPFHLDPSLKNWRDKAIEDSLAALLSRDSGMTAHSGTDMKHADYVLDTSVSPDGNQVMITLRLRPAAQHSATWTATFWRQREPDSIMARDFALAISSAMRTYRR